MRTTLGKHIKDCPPGWYIDWPIIHQFTKVNVAIQGVRFAVQSITTRDGVDISVRGAVLYRITDAHKAIFETDDFDQALEAIAGGVIGSFIANKTYDEIRDHKEIKAEIMKGLRGEATGWGIRLLRVYLPDICRSSSIRVLADQPTSLIPVDTGT